MTSDVVDERNHLIEGLRAAGPDAATLCIGWNTRLLLAHLVRRERSLVELGARVNLPVVTDAAERAMRAYAQAHGYEQMLGIFGAGAPRWSPFGIAQVQEAANLLEYVIHHEDVRRVDPEAGPRPLSDERQRAIFNRLRSAARFSMRSAPDPLELRWSAQQSIRVGRGEPSVVVSGPPVELALVAFGRQRAAKVDYSGDADAVARLTGATLRN